MMLLGCMHREMHVVSSAKTRREQQDEELALFRDMFKREKERNLSLLQPDSVELEPGQGTYLLHKLPPERKDFLSTEGSKNDYDWLKTPPATPLFPSLEMETNHPSMVIHTEIHLLHPFKPSRFKGKSEEAKPAPKSPTSISLSSSSSQPVTPKRSAAILEGPPNSTAKPKQSPPTSCKRSSSAATAGKHVREPSAGNSAPPEKLNSSIVSLIRSRIPPIVAGFSGKPPANLMTAAASSGEPRKASSPITREAKLGSGKQRKQSRSPALARSDAVVAEVMNAKGTGGVDKDSRTSVGSGKLNSRALHDSAHKHLVVKNTPVETSRLNFGNVKNTNPARPRTGTDSSQQTPNKDVKIPRGQLSKKNRNWNEGQSKAGK